MSKMQERLISTIGILITLDNIVLFTISVCNYLTSLLVCQIRCDWIAVLTKTVIRFYVTDE